MTVDIDLGDGLTPLDRLQKANEALQKELARASLNFARASVEIDVVTRLSAMLRAETELREDQVVWSQAKIAEMSNLLDHERAAKAVFEAGLRPITPLEQPSATSITHSFGELLHAIRASLAFRFGSGSIRSRRGSSNL